MLSVPFCSLLAFRNLTVCRSLLESMQFTAVPSRYSNSYNCFASLSHFNLDMCHNHFHRCLIVSLLYTHSSTSRRFSSKTFSSSSINLSQNCFSPTFVFHVSHACVIVGLIIVVYILSHFLWIFCFMTAFLFLILSEISIFFSPLLVIVTPPISCLILLTHIRSGLVLLYRKVFVLIWMNSFHTYPRNQCSYVASQCVYQMFVCY